MSRLDSRKVAANPGKFATRLTREQKEAGWEIVECPTCNGSGLRGTRRCGLCRGHKKIVTHK